MITKVGILCKRTNLSLDVESLIFIDTIWSPYNRAGQNYHESYLMDASQGPVALTVLNEADGSNAIYLEKVEYAVI